MQLSALLTLSVRVTLGLGYFRKPHGVKCYPAPVILIKDITSVVEKLFMNIDTR